MYVLDAKATRNALPFDRLLNAIEEGFRTDYFVPLRHHHCLANKDEEDATLLLMPAWWKEGLGGVKLVNVVPGNTARSRAAISASYLLFCRQTGEHLMLLDGNELTARRTAAASALAASKLARPDSRTLLIIGAGTIARNLPYAFRAILPIEKVLVHNRTVSRASKLVADLREDDIDAEVCGDAEDGVREADIISCATLAKTPILRGDWLESGTHIDLIVSFTPEMREADDEVIRKATVFIDTEHAIVECGDIAVPIAKGILTEHEIRSTLVRLCRDGVHRQRSRQDITLFKSVGSAIEDLAAASLAYKHVLCADATSL